MAGVAAENLKQTILCLAGITNTLNTILANVSESSLSAALSGAMPTAMAKERTEYAIEDKIGTPQTGKSLSTLIGNTNDAEDIDGTLMAKLRKIYNYSTTAQSLLNALCTDVSILTQDTSTLKRDTVVLKGDTSTLKLDTSVLKNDTSILKRDTSVLMNDTSVLLNDASILKNDTSILKNRTSDILSYDNVILADASVILADTSTLKKDTSILKGDTSILKGRAAKAAQESEDFIIEHSIGTKTDTSNTVFGKIYEVDQKIGTSTDPSAVTLQQKSDAILSSIKQSVVSIKGGSDCDYRATILPTIKLADGTFKIVDVTYDTSTTTTTIKIGSDSDQMTGIKVGDVIIARKAGYYLTGTTITVGADGVTLSGATQNIFVEGEALKITGFVDIKDSASTVVGQIITFESVDVARNLEETYRVINRKLGDFDVDESIETLLSDMSQAYTEHKRLIVDALNSLGVLVTPATESDSWVQLATWISELEVSAEPMTEEEITKIFNDVIKNYE